MEGEVQRGSAEKECRDKMHECWQNHFFIFPIALAHFYKVISEYYHPRPGVESVTISLTLHVHVTHYLCVKFLSQLQISM